MDKTGNDISNNNNEAEIDFIEIIVNVWLKRNFIIKTIAIFVLLGLLTALSSKNEYTASTTIVPQTSEKRASSSISGLAAMAGISIGSLYSNEVLSPSVYPRIMNNVNFQKDLIYSSYQFEKVNKPITYFEYFTNDQYSNFNLFEFIKKYTVGLPSIIIKLIKGETNDLEKSISFQEFKINQLTVKERNVIKDILQKLKFNLNDKEGFITISFTSQEPFLSAQIVKKSQELLQAYITKFKIEKVNNNLIFIENSYEEAKVNFEEKQSELARFRDANKSFSTELAKTQEDKLISEYNLLFGIYTELSKQKEQAKIAVTETTPILTIIEPVTIPSEKSGPNRFMTLFMFTFLGLFISLSWIIVFPYIKHNIDVIKSRKV